MCSETACHLRFRRGACACVCAPNRLPLLYRHLSKDRSLLLLYRSRDTSGLASNGPRSYRHYPWCRSRWKHALRLAHDTHVGGHEQRHSTYTAYTGSSLHGLGCGWGTLADTNQTHCIAQQRASTAGNSNGNTPTAGTLQEDFIVVCCSSARGFTALLKSLVHKI